MNKQKAKYLAEDLNRVSPPSLRHWETPQKGLYAQTQMRANASIEMGWGRLIFAHTFADNRELAEVLCEEKDNQRDIAFYLRDPHVVLSLAPHQLFLDPSHTYRLGLEAFAASGEPPRGFQIRRVAGREEAEAMNVIYASRHMMPTDPDVILRVRQGDAIRHFVAVDDATGEIIGTATGVDHVRAFGDPEQGSSFWCLAVSPQAPYPGVGRSLVEHVASVFKAEDRKFMDLSVMHNNAEAIALYEKLGFQRVPVFCVKRKNSINEQLYMVPPVEAALNPYAEIIVHEARRRGIAVEIVDGEYGYFALSFGGRRIVCRESLSELTTSVAMSRCDDKRVTRRLLERAGLRVPAQSAAGGEEANRAFLDAHGSVVVKPARGEQGAGISVDIRGPAELEEAIRRARRVCPDVILEACVLGEDLRLIVINFKMVAAAVRRPPRVIGNGVDSIRIMIEKQSRRRMAATGGESSIPLDDETVRCIRIAGYELDTILAEGEELTVRKAANLHTGGTIHDVTPELHPELARAAEEAARALDIPVVGLDFIVPDVTKEMYHVIEANERPGLANHEPQNPAVPFIDMLFPNTAAS